MAKACRLISFAFWILGVLTTLLVLVARLVPPLRHTLQNTMEMRSLLWLASVFFLGTIATWAVGRSSNA